MNILYFLYDAVVSYIHNINNNNTKSVCCRVMSRKNPLGKPDQRDLNENLAATHGLTHMIQECRKLFQVRHIRIFVTEAIIDLATCYFKVSRYFST